MGTTRCQKVKAGIQNLKSDQAITVMFYSFLIYKLIWQTESNLKLSKLGTPKSVYKRNIWNQKNPNEQVSLASVTIKPLKMNFDLKIMILVAVLVIPAISYDPNCYNRKVAAAYATYVTDLQAAQSPYNFALARLALNKYKMGQAQARVDASESAKCATTTPASSSTLPTTAKPEFVCESDNTTPCDGIADSDPKCTATNKKCIANPN